MTMASEVLDQCCRAVVRAHESNPLHMHPLHPCYGAVVTSSAACPTSSSGPRDVHPGGGRTFILVFVIQGDDHPVR
nr:unnamed protein product [Digitaria exilis]